MKLTARHGKSLKSLGDVFVLAWLVAGIIRQGVMRICGGRLGLYNRIFDARNLFISKFFDR